MELKRCDECGKDIFRRDRLLTLSETGHNELVRHFCSYDCVSKFGFQFEAQLRKKEKEQAKMWRMEDFV